MEPDFHLTLVEVIFLLVAVVISIPFAIFLKWIFKELKKEQSKEE